MRSLGEELRRKGIGMSDHWSGEVKTRSPSAGLLGHHGRSEGGGTLCPGRNFLRGLFFADFSPSLCPLDWVSSPFHSDEGRQRGGKISDLAAPTVWRGMRGKLEPEGAANGLESAAWDLESVSDECAGGEE